jgi:hypothetical protein
MAPLSSALSHQIEVAVSLFALLVYSSGVLTIEKDEAVSFSIFQPRIDSQVVVQTDSVACNQVLEGELG